MAPRSKYEALDRRVCAFEERSLRLWKEIAVRLDQDFQEIVMPNENSLAGSSARVCH